MAVKRDENGRIKPKPKPIRRASAGPLHSATSSKPPEEPAVAVERAPEAVNVRVDARGPLADFMCGAKLRGEKVGLLCRNAKMTGAKRCRMHGSASRNAREKARERILMASDHAAKKLIEFMNDNKAPYSVKLAAARDLLDRAELAGASRVEVEMPGFLATIDRAVQIRRASGPDVEWPAAESRERNPRVVDVQPIDSESRHYAPTRPLTTPTDAEDYEPAATRKPKREPTPLVIPPREDKIDVTPKLPSYLDAQTGGKRRPGSGRPRTTQMTR